MEEQVINHPQAGCHSLSCGWRLQVWQRAVRVTYRNNCSIFAWLYALQPQHINNGGNDCSWCTAFIQTSGGYATTRLTCLTCLTYSKTEKALEHNFALKITDWSLFLPAVLLWLKSKKNVDAGSMENKNKTENAAEIRFLSCRGMWREKENVYDRGMDSHMVVVSAKRGRRRFGNHSLTVWKRCKQKKND